MDYLGNGIWTLLFILVSQLICHKNVITKRAQKYEEKNMENIPRPAAGHFYLRRLLLFFDKTFPKLTMEARQRHLLASKLQMVKSSSITSAWMPFWK